MVGKGYVNTKIAKGHPLVPFYFHISHKVAKSMAKLILGWHILLMISSQIAHSSCYGAWTCFGYTLTLSCEESGINSCWQGKSIPSITGVIRWLATTNMCSTGVSIFWIYTWVLMWLHNGRIYHDAVLSWIWGKNFWVKCFNLLPISYDKRYIYRGSWVGLRQLCQNNRGWEA